MNPARENCQHSLLISLPSLNPQESNPTRPLRTSFSAIANPAVDAAEAAAGERQRSRGLLPPTTLQIHHRCCCSIANVQRHDLLLNLVRMAAPPGRSARPGPAAAAWIVVAGHLVLARQQVVAVRLVTADVVAGRNVVHGRHAVAGQLVVDGRVVVAGRDLVGAAARRSSESATAVTAAAG